MSEMQFLPPPARPPDDPTSLLLNARVGWRAERLDQIDQSQGDGALVLAPAPGTGRSLAEPSGSFGGLVTPLNVALDDAGNLFLLDAKSATLKQFDSCACAFVSLRCFGGTGGGPRQLSNPNGIAIANGNLYVCDTGNHRVVVISLFGLVLRDHWTLPGGSWDPFDIVLDRYGRAYVSDGANGCIHRLGPTGRLQKSFCGLGKVSFLALDRADHLYSYSQGETTVRIMDTDGTLIDRQARPETVSTRFTPLPFAVDAEGNLHLQELCADAANCERPATVPERTRCEREPGKVPAHCVYDLSGNELACINPLRAQFAPCGTYISEPLDSGFYRCQWHRIIFSGSVPRGARVVVSTLTAEARLAAVEVAALPEENWETRQTMNGTTTGDWDCLVRSGGGRYLWLRLELEGNGLVTPRLDAAILEFPRVSLRRYLPAVFGQEPVSADFTDRFLAVFDTTLRSIERQLDTQARLFDPLSAPAAPGHKGSIDFLSWLSNWVGMALDRNLPEAKRRLLLKNAGSLFPLRGTSIGLYRQLLLFLGMDQVAGCCTDECPRDRCTPRPSNCAPRPTPSPGWALPPLIVEHYKLRRWLWLGMGRLDDQAVLWGQKIVNRSPLGTGAQVGVTQLKTTQDPLHDPFYVYAHKFTVFVPACYGRTDTTRRQIENLIAAASPAHTVHTIQYVQPRFRIGVQSMIGLDSVVGRYPQGVTLAETALAGASVLTGAPGKQNGPSFAIGKTGRVGTTAVLD